MSALSPRQMYLLDSACHPLMEVFGWSTYLVGTAMEPRDGQPPRDIDVRTIVDDKQHDRLKKAIGEKGIAFLGIAIGQYLASLTGLPIDYQIQRMTEANALHNGTRNPLGHRNLANYKGDAQPADAKKMMAAMEAQIRADHPSDVLWNPGVKLTCWVCRCTGYHAIGCTNLASPTHSPTQEPQGPELDSDESRVKP